MRNNQVWDPANPHHKIILDMIYNFAFKVKLCGYDVYLAESGAYGFWVANDRIYSFGVDFGMIHVSGNYKAINKVDIKKIGTGWRILDSATYATECDIANISKVNAPDWAVSDVAFRYTTLADMLDNKFTRYNQI